MDTLAVESIVPVEEVKSNRKTADLSAEVALAVPKQPGDRVRVRRVFGDKYRCNWLTTLPVAAPAGAIAPKARRGETDIAVETFRIRDSKFLRVTRAADGLVIEDQTAGRD